MRDGEENRLQSFENHLEPWVDLYNKKREEQQSLCSSGESMLYVCSALSHAQGLNKVVIRQPGGWRCLQDDDLRPLGIKRHELCTIVDCKLEADEHLALQPLPHSNSFPDPLDDLHPAMAAIHISKSIIRELDMEHGYDKEIFSPSGLLLSAFNASAPQSHYLAYVLPMLTKLHLNLDLRCNDLHSINETSFNERHVASTLSAAINLDCLSVSMQSIGMLSIRSPHPTTIFKPA